MQRFVLSVGFLDPIAVPLGPVKLRALGRIEQPLWHSNSSSTLWA